MIRKRASINRVLLWTASVCILAGFASHAYSDALLSKKDTSTILFAVGRGNGKSFIDPIVIIEKGKLVDPPIHYYTLDHNAQIDAFVTRYFRPGLKYRLLKSGGRAGTATVEQWEELGCAGLIAKVRLEKLVSHNFDLDGLATNSLSLGDRKFSRRVPTDSEGASALKLARQLYRQNGVPTELIQMMKTINLLATDLNADGIAELIGQFDIRDRGDDPDPHSLFFIAESQGQGLQPGLVLYHFGGGNVSAVQKLVDLIDLDGDGIAEVITKGEYYETWDYTIYKMNKGKWGSIYEGGGSGGC